jgi:AraC-like DNA-binding protein
MQNWHQEYAAPPELQDTIRCFWYNKSEFDSEAPSSFEVMPDSFAEIIFHFGGGCSLSNNGVLQPLPSPFMMGLLNQPATFYTTKCLEIIAIRCYPWTVFDLLGLPSGKGVHLLEHPIAQLHAVLNELMKAGKITEAIAAVQQYFLDARSRISQDSMLFKAGVAMRDANGTLPVSQVAAAANATVRTLERNFKQTSGHTVKDVSGLIRFEQARNQLWHHPETNLAGLAHELGYADQAHLSKEFKRYAGVTPGAFARKAKKERPMDFVAFIQS